MKKNEAQKFIEKNKKNIQTRETRFTNQQLALFRMLAKDLGVEPEEVAMLLINQSFSRIRELENIQMAQTKN